MSTDSDIVGLGQVSRSVKDIEQTLAVNAANHRAYAAELAATPGLRLLPYPEGEASNHQYVVVEVERYTDEQIAAWDEEDRLGEGERQGILDRLEGRG